MDGGGSEGMDGGVFEGSAAFGGRSINPTLHTQPPTDEFSASRETQFYRTQAERKNQSTRPLHKAVVMGTNVAANLQHLHETREESTPLSWSSTLGGFHHVMNALMALLIGLKYATGMENLITLLVVALVFYFGLMSFARIFHADHDHRDFGAFINKISILFGIFALIIELLIIVLAYGSVPLFLWSICMVSMAVAVLVLLRLASVELREKLILITGHLMQYWTTFYDSSAVASQEMINLDHEAQDQNQIKELPPV